MHSADIRRLLFGVVIILLLAAVFHFSTRQYDSLAELFHGATGTDSTATATDSLSTLPADSASALADGINDKESMGVDSLFAFDPNTADSLTLLRLGLTRWQASSILRYRRRGGIYQHREDFARVYRLSLGQYERLAPYIVIGKEFRPAADFITPPRPNYGHRNDYTGRTADARTGSRTSGDAGRYHDDSTRQRREISLRDSLYNGRRQPKIQRGTTVELNIADTAVMKTVPGIGSYYAHRIVNYGQRLGGYVSIDQLDEIEDFPVEAKSFFRLEPGFAVRRINVNRLTERQLSRHPYVSYAQARAIVNYRRLQGPLKSLTQLRLLPEFTPEELKRLEPYVAF